MKQTEKTFKIYRWSRGQVIDTFIGNRADCQAYCERWPQYTCEWQEL